MTYDQRNAALYDDGRVTWRPGYGWTSRLWARLFAAGWSWCSNRAGIIFITDNTGVQVQTGHISHFNALVDLAEMMR